MSRAESHDVGGDGRLDTVVEGDSDGGVDGRLSNEKGAGDGEGLSLSAMRNTEGRSRRSQSPKVSG